MVVASGVACGGGGVVTKAVRAGVGAAVGAAGTGVGAEVTGVGDVVAGCGLGTALGEPSAVQEDPDDTGQDEKQGVSSTVAPLAKVTTKPAPPLLPWSAALQVPVTPTRLMAKDCPSTTTVAKATASGRFEKITFVNQALSPSSTVATAPLPVAVSQAIGS